MELSVKQTTFEEIESWRDLYRQEMNCQIIHDSIHSRSGWTLEYFLSAGGAPVGYGSIAVAGPWKDKPTLYEFYVLPYYRSFLFDLFSVLLSASGANRIETQSNDSILTAMLHTFAHDVVSESILYHDKLTTTLAPAEAFFRRAIASDDPKIPADQLFSHGVVEVAGAVAAKGGILFHYNRPYGDIYYGGRRGVSEAWFWLIPGSRAKASLLRTGKHPGGSMQSEEYCFPQNTSESWLCSVWAHFNRFRFPMIHIPPHGPVPV